MRVHRMRDIQLYRNRRAARPEGRGCDHASGSTRSAIMSPTKPAIVIMVVVAASAVVGALWAKPPARPHAPQPGATSRDFDREIQENAARMLEEGKQTFRF